MPAWARRAKAAEAMEMGADDSFGEYSDRDSSDPVALAQAFKKAIEAGREARKHWSVKSSAGFSDESADRIFSSQTKSTSAKQKLGARNQFPLAPCLKR